MGKMRDVRPGERYGRLVIVEEAENANSRRRFLCRCDCGRIATVQLIKLTTGHTQSCGCRVRENRMTHGLKNHPLYGVWCSMRARCTNPGVKAYTRYGGRGITVCAEWMSFEPFYEWAIANGYQPRLTLDRIDNDGSYEPENCQWIPHARQANNRRNNRVLQYQGRSTTLADLARETGLSPSLLWKRLRRGWSVEDAVSHPLLGQDRATADGD